MIYPRDPTLKMDDSSRISHGFKMVGLDDLGHHWMGVLFALFGGMASVSQPDSQEEVPWPETGRVELLV